MNLKSNFKIGKILVGTNHKCLIIAEISANHNNNFKTIKKLIDSAKKNGADIVKIQTYTADTLTINSDRKDFQIKKKNPWSKNKNLWNLYKKAETSKKLTSKIFKYSRSVGMEIFSSPFDISAVDFLEKIKCPAYKIASPEICHIPLIERVAKTKKPIIISLGLANLKDIHLALKTIKKIGNNKVILLQCVSSYPAPIHEQNIKSINQIKKKYKTLIGLSDHTKGFIAALSAVAVGGNVIEKHFNLSKNKSVDSFFSSTEKEFKIMVDNIRLIEATLGNGEIKISKSSKENFNSRRSIYVSKEIKKNELITEQNIKIVRPNYGLHPKFYQFVLNKRSNVNLKVGDRFKLKYVKKR
jgi:pseudaminic acid synthase